MSSGPERAVPFADRLLDWFDRHGRHDLPWQHPRTPYRVWISEIMLQQTQVQTVIPYFLRFVRELPDLPALAAAPLDRVMALWSGLGYYRRARNLHAAARLCVQDHGGRLPADQATLMTLPGIGRTTAAAILAQAFGQRCAILDGNVKRTLARWRAIEGWPGQGTVEKQLWSLAEDLLPAARLADYTQALMDLGATVCTRHAPACGRCPVREDCAARRQGRTEVLPTPRPTRALPTRQCSMLLAMDGRGQVLLERRNGAGVWQDLWSLPEAEGAAAPEGLAQRLLAGPTTLRSLPAIDHAFTHYRLRITPWLAGNVQSGARIADNEGLLRWAGPDEWSAIGMPAPVRSLLQSLELK